MGVKKWVIKNMKEIKKWVIEEILIFTLMFGFQVEKLRNSKKKKKFLIEKKNEMMKNVVCENLFG